MKARFLLSVGITSLLVLPAAIADIGGSGSTQTSVAPPVAKQVHTENRINDTILIDDYAWLRDKKNPEVSAYLQAENSYTEKVMEPTKPLQDKLYKEMLSHIKETDVTVPYKDGQYFYYSRTEEGKQYPIFCRKKSSIDAPEVIILDVNALSVGEKSMSLGAFKVSEDGN